MTNQPPGRDGSPSVAALAIHVNALHREVEQLTGRVHALSTAQREQAAGLASLAELRGQVEQILALLGDQDDHAPAAWFWLTMSEQESDAKLGELVDWVEAVLRKQYPDYLTNQLRPCWPNHPEARWELAWLYQLWTLSYLARRSSPKDAADWHDRWLPGIRRRLSDIMTRCDRGCRRQPGAAPMRDRRY